MKKFRSSLFRLTLGVAVLGVTATACSAPTASSSASPTAIVATESPVALTTTAVKEGDGVEVSTGAAFMAHLTVWSDKFDGTPYGPGSMDILMLKENPNLQGVSTAAQSMKKGGVTRLEMTAKELFGKMPAQAKMDPTKKFFIELTIKDVYPEEPFEVKTVTPGKGDRAAKDGDVLMLHYVGRLDNLKDGKIFDSSRKRGNPFPVTLGAGQVIPGWDQGLVGIKQGEVRTLSIPHYMAYGDKAQGEIPAKSRLFFEVELLNIVEKGELISKTTTEGSGEAIKSGEKGSFHYTGWLDGFDGKKKFDSSVDRNQPFSVTLGQGMVIKGWDQGLVGMKPGETRQLTIPYNLAYGPKGRPPSIPAFATLYFEVKYLGPAK